MQKSDKKFFFETFADEFDSKMNRYDLQKRLDVVYKELLTENISGKLLLDCGCGTGWFSKHAAERGAIVTSMDIGPKLLAKVAEKCESTRIIGSVLNMPFPDNSFDLIVCSEVIEHVESPVKAVGEIYRVLKPGGTMTITTPNRIWYFAIWFANTFRLRPYEGLENWIGWCKMKSTLKQLGLTKIKMVGIHLFPFIFKFLNPVLNFFHRFNKILGPVMVNMAIKANKK